MNFSNRIIVFLLGLSVGLLIGAGFFIFKIDDYISKLEIFKGTPDTVKVITETKDNNSKASKSNFLKNTQKVNTGDRVDSSKIVPDSLALNQKTDSVPKDTVISFNTTNPDEIVVKKDELLSVKNIDVVNYSAESKNMKDSLIEKESGIKDVQSFAFFKVEFWQSPINYKGYKMSKNKIVLFGIAQDEPVKIYKVDDAFYMKHLQNVYRLDFTNDFRQFESVKDQNVLAKIK